MNPQILDRIKKIHKTSQEYNAKLGKDHQERLFELMEEHVAEIKELADKGDKHFLVETGDLAMLCFELMLEHDASIDEILLKCCGRYERKLAELISEKKEN